MKYCGNFGIINIYVQIIFAVRMIIMKLKKLNYIITAVLMAIIFSAGAVSIAHAETSPEISQSMEEAGDGEEQEGGGEPVFTDPVFTEATAYTEPEYTEPEYTEPAPTELQTEYVEPQTEYAEPQTEYNPGVISNDNNQPTEYFEPPTLPKTVSKKTYSTNYTAGIVSWVCVGVGLIVVIAVIVSTKAGGRRKASGI